MGGLVRYVVFSMLLCFPDIVLTDNLCTVPLAFFGNNHPVFGICFHHHQHPVGTLKRVWILFGSMAFGLALTNIMYLGFVLYSDDGVDGTIQIAVFNTTEDGAKAVVNSLSSAASGVSKYELILWLVGKLLVF